MELLEIQNQIDAYIQKNSGYFSNEDILLNVHEETSELSRLIQHASGTKKLKNLGADFDIDQELMAEVGGLFFTLICFANKNNISLQQAIEMTLVKYNIRDGNSGRFNTTPG